MNNKTNIFEISLTKNKSYADFSGQNVHDVTIRKLVVIKNVQDNDHVFF